MNTPEQSFEALLASYNYEFPKELIAQKGVEPRESARLLVYDRATRGIALKHFSDLSELLDSNTVLVFNETKVVPARVCGITVGGREVEITATQVRDREIESLSSRRLDVGEVVNVQGEFFTVLRREETRTYYATNLSVHEMGVFLEKNGEMPLPPYIKHPEHSREEIKRRYQSVFAKHEGSFAAPTASLHFSEKLLSALRERGVGIEYVTLHVGLGTFAPLTTAHVQENRLHQESYAIDPETAERINRAYESGKHIIPVGTTSLRTLESAADLSGRLVSLEGMTDLFIRPGYRFKVARGLITNFHVPQSSLLMLVDAFLGGTGEWRTLYEKAIDERFRLFSLGDGMLIL